MSELNVRVGRLAGSALEEAWSNDERMARAPIRQQVAQRLLAGIFQGTFRPGEHLVVQRLSERFHTSPTPVREAMVELAGLRMVELLHNRGAVVRPFGPQQVREISQIRRVLEVEATRCACGRIAPVDLEAIEQELVRLETIAPTRPGTVPAARSIPDCTA